MAVNSLRVQNVSLSLGRSPRLLLNDISFELEAGEIAVLLGAPGSGKTLLLQLLNGLRSPTQGQILWQGQPLSTQPPVALRRQIVLQPQQPRLLGMTGQEAIAYPLHLQGLSSSAIQQRLDHWLDILKIPLAWLEQREATLPPSAAQAIALTRALAMEPQLLLLDDPWLRSPEPKSLSRDESAALPVWKKPGEKIQQALSILTQRGGAVIWAMTAEENAGESEIEAIAQRLLCLSKGRLIHNGHFTSATWQQAIADAAKASDMSAVCAATAEVDEWD